MRAQEASCPSVGTAEPSATKKGLEGWPRPKLPPLQGSGETQAPLPKEGLPAASGKVGGRHLFPRKGPFSPFQAALEAWGVVGSSLRAKGSLWVEACSGAVKVIARCHCHVNSCAPGPR